MCGDLPRPERLQPNEERLRLLDAVARFVAGLSARAPVVLVLDDLHWADASTLLMLRHIARFVSPHRVVIGAAYRAGEAGSELVETFGALRTEIDMATVRLHGLDQRSTHLLVNAVTGSPVSAAVVEAIMAETRGNPLFAREVARHLVEEDALRTGLDGTLSADALPDGAPEGVRQVLARRRARLSPHANLFLDTAAGFDGPFPFAVVARAAGLDDTVALAVLDEVIHAGLVEADPAPERYQFSHALIRHAVHGDLNPSRRVRLHRRLAEALAGARGRSSVVVAPAEIAWQYQASAALPGADAGVGPAIEAADQAAEAAAHDEAATFLRMACALASPDDQRLLATRCRLGLELAWALRFDEAVDVARDAADQVAAERGPAAAAAYLAEVTSALASADSAPHAWSLTAQGLRYVGRRRDRVWAALVLHDLDRREADDPNFRGMILDVLERREALRILLDTGGVTGRVDLARFAAAAVHGTRARVPADAAQDPTVRLFLLGDYAGALPLFDAEASEAHARGALALEAYCRGAAARCHVALGDLDAGRAGIAEELRIAGRIGQGRWGWQRIHLIGTLDALAHATDAGWTEVLAHLEDAFDPDNPAGRRFEASAAALAAKVQARLGRADDALRFVARTLPALRLAPAWATNYVRTLCDAVEAVWLVGGPGQGDPPVLAALEVAARDRALPADFRFPMMDTRLTLARLCALDGRHDEAAGWFAEARVTLDAQGARPLRAIVDADAAVVELWAGRGDSARALLATAVGQFDRLGMTGWVRRATARCGVSAR